MYGASYKGEPIQQEDNYKDFCETIIDGGLKHAYYKQEDPFYKGEYYRTKVSTDEKRKVTIIGGGIAGLVTAFELAQIGHEVQILELQSRVGGRIKTCREKFFDGLHSEGGAMRIPRNHFLTHAYLDKFDIELRPFQNYQENAYMYLYGDKITMKEFSENNKKYCDLYWPGWDANLPSDLKKEVTGVLDYFERSTAPVMEHIRKNTTTDGWNDWLKTWSKLSVEDFLRTDPKDLLRTTDPKDFLRTTDPIDKLLRPWLPWPEVAINAYKVASYSPMLDCSLVFGLRDTLGHWWAKRLQTPVEGMDTLPKAFLRKNNGYHKDINLSRKIFFNMKAEKIEVSEKGRGRTTTVFARNVTNGQQYKFDGDAVFVTVPLHILRDIEMPKLLTPQLSDAITDMNYTASTKIMLQSRERFWEKQGIIGGFSKTNMTIGQLHYPGYETGQEDEDEKEKENEENDDVDEGDKDKDDEKDDEDDHVSEDKRGILMVYTWGTDALILGSQTHQEAIQTAVNQISKIHPEFIDDNQFEVAMVQAWENDPSAQGAFVSLKPHEYLDNMKTIFKSSPPVYFAGEAISWANGWIQGAIFSALLQAFRFQAHLEVPQNNLEALMFDNKFTRFSSPKPPHDGRGKKRSQRDIPSQQTGVPNKKRK
ncbi:L-amino-acid oxidase-like [Mya arenaria]|uniref:L-amino-acid oxidase-like n=1 Tax=Mya arenaria TaxID=6604 RepID=UPI0022E7ED28|nr:L-amino-acid oxidase-like [Mya arenaria]